MEYNVFRTREGGIIVTSPDNGRLTLNDTVSDGDFWNNQALIALSYNRPQWSRTVDTHLLAAQYAYSGETEPWKGVRPSCTSGTVGSGYCTESTEYGDIYCAKHGGVARPGVTFP